MGTRFLPATKANPKEMLPIVDKPLIQYAVEEALDAGITELIFVTSIGKRAIEDHFDVNYELEAKLEEKQNYGLLAEVRNILPDEVSCAYIRQPQPLGLGHAVWCARNIIQNEPFVVVLADELLNRDYYNPLNDMIQLYQDFQAPIIACWQVPYEEVGSYGICEFKDSLDGSGFSINSIMEKPVPANAPSNYAAVGRYVLTPQVFQHLEHLPPGAGGEIQLTDALAELIDEHGLYGYLLREARHDCGSKLGYLKAMIEYGLKHSDLGDDLRHYIDNYLSKTVANDDPTQIEHT